MTSSHKIVLSLIAVICITLIVFYSVKGNTQPAPVPAKRLAAAPVESSAAGRDAGRQAGADTIAPAGSDREQAPAGIDEIMARVKQLDEGNRSGPPAAPAASSIVEPAASTPPTSNVPAATTASDTGNDAGPSAAADSTQAAQPDPPIGSGRSPFDVAPSTLDGGVVTQTPAVVEVPAANSAAEVPSLTLGEPPADPSKDTPAAAADAADEHKSFGDLAIIDDAPPTLVKVNETPQTPSTDKSSDAAAAKTTAAASNDAGGTTSASADKTSDSNAKTADKPPATAKSTETPRDPAALVIDPHRPAIKADAPVDKSSAADAASDVRPSANTLAEVPFNVDRSTVDEASKKPKPPTYTIRPGDTFSSIATALFGAERYWIDIADANPDVDPKKIRVGQVIKLPVIDADDAAESRKTAAKPEAKSEQPAAKRETTADKTEPKAEPKPLTDVKVHEVRAGENLSSISRRYFNTPDHWRHIYLTNREVIGSDPGKLQAGVKLKIVAPAKD